MGIHHRQITGRLDYLMARHKKGGVVLRDLYLALWEIEARISGRSILSRPEQFNLWDPEEAESRFSRRLKLV